MRTPEQIRIRGQQITLLELKLLAIQKMVQEAATLADQIDPNGTKLRVIEWQQRTRVSYAWRPATEAEAARMYRIQPNLVRCITVVEREPKG